MAKTLSVAAIQDGTVIDHIPCGVATILLQLLKLMDRRHRISVGLNLSSTSMGLKDLIKIENRFLSEKEVHDIAVFAPQSTISIIKNYKLASKIQAKLPSCIERILVCPNGQCITNCEKVTTLFHVEEYKTQVHLKCHYCEKVFARQAIKDYLP